jgi:hypothetical protein
MGHSAPHRPYVNRNLRAIGHPARPQVSVEASLKFGDRIKVGPGAPIEDRGNRRVVHIRDTSRGSNALISDGRSQILCELARDLGRGIYRRHFRPAVRELVRMEPGRSGHRSSVDDGAGVRA